MMDIKNISIFQSQTASVFIKNRTLSSNFSLILLSWSDLNSIFNLCGYNVARSQPFAANPNCSVQLIVSAAAARGPLSACWPISLLFSEKQKQNKNLKLTSGGLPIYGRCCSGVLCSTFVVTQNCQS